MSAPASISDEGVIYPPRTPQEAEARALELRIALHAVRMLEAVQKQANTVLYLARYGNCGPAAALPFRSYSPRRLKRLRWTWKHQEPAWLAALGAQGA